MTYRELLIGLAIGALALAALALAFAIRATVRRARDGRPRLWVGLFFRGALIAGLLAVGAASLANVPPPDPVNHPNPAAADATIAFLKTSRDATPQTVVGVSARDGSTRWIRTLDGPIASLLSPTPDMVLAPTAVGLYALRTADGAVLWRSQVVTYIAAGAMAADEARVYAVVPASPARGTGAQDIIALDLHTGALAWRVPLPASIQQGQRLAVGDGLVYVVGAAAHDGPGFTPWMVAALRAADGAAQWATTGPVVMGTYAQVQAVFLLRGYAVIVPVVGPVTGLRERDGAIAWTATPNLEEPDNPPQIISATADSDTIYMVWQPYHWATGVNGRPIPPPMSMSAMAVGGTIRWHMNVQPASSGWSSLTIRDGVLLSGNNVTASRAFGGYNANGSLLSAYDAASGRLLWRDNTPRVGVSWNMSTQISPWGGDGAAYLMGVQSGSYYIQDRFNCVFLCSPGVAWLYAVNVHTGAPWWRVRTGSVNLARPFVF
ncbi:MAG TPA: PQQ-binding-like beta-propeller repeat protein [Ktedonobacterales bacterium]|nr:PQQ-binding-like beta-propeller repeat protein [Ktedonobacterales bacterium]